MTTDPIRKTAGARLTAIAVCILGGAAAVVYFFAFRKYYDPELHHFDPTILVTVGLILFICTLIAAVITLAWAPRKEYLDYDNSTSAESFGTAFLAFIFLGSGIVTYISGMKYTGTMIGSVCSKLIIIFSVIAAVFFLLRSIPRFQRSVPAQILSVFPVLWGVAAIFKYYFNISDYPLNDPETILNMIMFSAAVLFFLSEARASMGYAKASYVLASSGLVFGLGAVCAAVKLILQTLRAATMPAPGELLILLACGVLSMARIVSVRSHIKTAEPDISPLDTITEEADGSGD